MDRPHADGVVELLRALYARLRPGASHAGLAPLIPAYERLLRPSTPHANAETAMMHEIQRIRAILREGPDLFGTVQQFDEQVETCLELGDQAGTLTACWVSGALRLLLSLAGGRDGNTFVLEDPTRVRPKNESILSAAKPRVGERINMQNLDLVAQSHGVLVSSTPLSLDPQQILAQYEFESLGAIDSRRSPLWYPGAISPGVGDKIPSPPLGVPTSILFSATQDVTPKKAGIPRLIDISPQESTINTTDRKAILKQREFDPVQTSNAWQSRVDTEVFFFDGSRVIKSASPDSLEARGSTTDVSSCDDNVDTETTWSFAYESSSLGSWEQLGYDSSEHPIENVSCLLSQPVIEFTGVNSGDLGRCIEVDEVDVVEYSAMALCGIDSVIFRRVVSTASFRLPRRVRVKLRSSSSASLSTALEEFRAAGTAFMRLEYISTYFSQDSSRGGITAQALGNTLSLYLKSYQSIIRSHAEFRHTKTQGVSLISFLVSTRSLRRQIATISNALGCNNSSSEVFWRLLGYREFPAGVDLLNLLHRDLQQWEQEDVHGEITKLFKWLLVRSAEPFIALLSHYINTGETPLELDPHNEFRLSVYSTLQSFGDASDGGDLDHDILPRFLRLNTRRVQRIGKLQHMLNSILPISDKCVWGQLHLNYHVSAAQAQLHRVQGSLQLLMSHVDKNGYGEKSLALAWEHFRSPSKSPRRDSVDEWMTSKRKRLELNEVEDSRTQVLSQLEQFDGDMKSGTSSDWDQYLTWRRTRASQLSESKMKLLQQMEKDVHSWRAAREDLPQQSESCIDELPIEKCGVSDGDSEMNDGGTEDHDVQLSRPNSFRPVDRGNDSIGEDGLLWRPRIRMQKVPGGGGSDAALAIYSQNDAQTHQMESKPRSIALAQASGGDGSAARTAIYGDVLMPRNDSRREGNYISVPVTDGDAGATSRDGIPVIAHQFSSPYKSPAEVCKKSCICPVNATSECYWGQDVSTPRVAEEILQSSTPFLRPNVSSEDEAILHGILQPDRSATSPATSFRLLSQIALEEPIASIHDSLDKIALRAALQNLDLKNHLKWLRRIALMSEGLCMAIFSHDLFTNLQSETRVLLALPGRLTTMLALSMIEARIVKDSSQLPPFEYRVEDGFVRAVTTGPTTPSMTEVVTNLTLNYILPPHLSSLLTSTSMEHYLDTHRLLLLLRLTQHESKDVWQSWRKSPVRDDFPEASQRICDVFLHSTHLVLSAFIEAFSVRVLNSAWKTFIAGIEVSNSVWNIRKLHECFMAEAHACCFLDPDQSEILHSLHQFVDNVWFFGHSLRLATHPSEKLCAIQSKLCSVAKTQKTVMTVLVSQLRNLETCRDSKVRAFAEELLVRLNFNGNLDSTTAQHSAATSV